jgi:preprotein translocase subunit SecG
MGFLIGLLTLAMVVDCFALIFLVLIQLPKKEAGAGLAFGGAATDALFGAGSGTVLTKITKYFAGAFFVLALGISILGSISHRQVGSAFRQGLLQPAAKRAAPTTSSATPAPANASPLAAPTTNLSIPIGTPQAESTNQSAPPAASSKTNAP